jgi:hypothetical protein
VRFEPHRVSLFAVIWRRVRGAQHARPVGV